MPVRPIVLLGEPGDEILRRPADPIARVDGSIQALIDDMIDTVRDAGGVGLAAPQVGVSLRLVVINVPEIPTFAVINGDVVRHTGRRWLEEGCLSIPGYRGNLYRSIRVTIGGLDRFGRPIRIRAVDDLLAQALEHEIDHTRGTLYIDYVQGELHVHRGRRGQNDEVADREGEGPIQSAAPSYEHPLRIPKRHGRPPLITSPRRRVSAVNEALAARNPHRLRA